MGARFNSSNIQDEGSEVDISPLIDVVFILLIFFIVTTIFVEEEGVQINKPQSAAAASDSDAENIVIVVSENGAVLSDGKKIGVSGVQATIRRKSSAEKLPVLIQAKKKSNLGVFMRVYDEALLSGNDVSVTTVN
ncbi:MAG: biopolymer transporter ExbD [Verrucomicrobiota bacterium]